MSQYKIGDFANYLGVTPDLIKHYEKYDIIQGIKHEHTKYRYYSFWQSSVILYSKMYQNMGFSLKEISQLISEVSTEELFKELNVKVDDFTQNIEKQGYILNSINELISYEEEIKNNAFDGQWEIKNMNDFYFLPHSKNCKYYPELINDMEIHKWINLLPITNLCTKIGFKEGKEDSVYFGLSVIGKVGRKFDLNLTSPIEKVMGSKTLVYKNRVTVVKEDPVNFAESIFQTCVGLIEKHNFKINGDIYLRTLFQTIENEENVLYRLIFIPIE